MVAQEVPLHADDVLHQVLCHAYQPVTRGQPGALRRRARQHVGHHQRIAVAVHADAEPQVLHRTAAVQLRQHALNPVVGDSEVDPLELLQSGEGHAQQLPARVQQGPAAVARIERRIHLQGVAHLQETPAGGRDDAGRDRLGQGQVAGGADRHHLVPRTQGVGCRRAEHVTRLHLGLQQGEIEDAVVADHLGRHPLVALIGEPHEQPRIALVLRVHLALDDVVVGQQVPPAIDEEAAADHPVGYAHATAQLDAAVHPDRHHPAEHFRERRRRRQLRERQDQTALRGGLRQQPHCPRIAGALGQIAQRPQIRDRIGLLGYGAQSQQQGADLVPGGGQAPHLVAVQLRQRPAGGRGASGGGGRPSRRPRRLPGTAPVPPRPDSAVPATPTPARRASSSARRCAALPTRRRRPGPTSRSPGPRLRCIALSDSPPAICRSISATT